MLVLGGVGEGLLGLHHLDVVGHPGSEAVLRLLQLLAGEGAGALGHADALLRRLQVEEHRLHLVVDPGPDVREAGPLLLLPGLGLAHAGLDAPSLEERHPERGPDREGGAGAGDVVPDGAVVPAHREGRQPLALRRLAQRLRRVDPGLGGLEVGPAGPRALDRLLDGQRDGRGAWAWGRRDGSAAPAGGRWRGRGPASPWPRPARPRSAAGGATAPGPGPAAPRSRPRGPRPCDPGPRRAAPPPCRAVRVRRRCGSRPRPPAGRPARRRGPRGRAPRARPGGPPRASRRRRGSD